MWAASDITFLAPITVGASINRVSRIASIAEKDGSSGRLGFVEVEHVTRADGVDAVRERQTLVYRAAVPSETPLSPPEPGEGKFAPSNWDAHRTITPAPPLLFQLGRASCRERVCQYV